MASNPPISSDPFLKYPGGKRGLLKTYREHFPTHSDGRYIEPMVGGGAVFFSWSHSWSGGAIIGDYNSDLVNAYREVQRDSYIVSAQLNALINYYNNCTDRRGFFEGVRANFNIGERSAANFIFLNRSGFNGLVRYNKKGEYNVSWGQREKLSTKVVQLVRNAGEVLSRQGVSIQDAGDFSWTLTEAREGDFVYFDPPYLTDAGFVDYSSGGFSLDDHIRLRDVAIELVSRGVEVRISNALTVETLELYSRFSIVELEARRVINCDGAGRGDASELLACGGINGT